MVQQDPGVSPSALTRLQQEQSRNGQKKISLSLNHLPDRIFPYKNNIIFQDGDQIWILKEQSQELLYQHKTLATMHLTSISPNGEVLFFEKEENPQANIVLLE